MIRAYEEIIEFIAAGSRPEDVVSFQPSQLSKDQVEDLIHREKTSGLTPDESAELDQFLQLEHIMRLAKARARKLLSRD